jgi:predicted ATPase
LGEDLLRLSRQRSDTAGIVLSHFCCGRSLMYAGRFRASRSQLEEVLALYDPIAHSSLLFLHQAGFHPQMVSQAYLGIILLCLGYPDQALAQSKMAIAEARRLAHPPILAESLALGALPLSLIDHTFLGECADQLVTVATEQGFSQWLAEGTIYRGWVKVQNGDVAEGIFLMRSGLNAFRATGAEMWMPYGFALFARANAIAGKTEEATVQLDNALQIVKSTGVHWLEAELNRQKGKLLLRQGRPDRAEELYHNTLSIAREQEAKLWELRAALDLAKLWGEQARRAEAHDLLAPVYAWFTEGFNTPDLKDAKALLEVLGGSSGVNSDGVEAI